MSALSRILPAIEATGLGAVGAFHPEPEDKAPEGIGTLVLLGPAGNTTWAAFESAPELTDGAPDPLDRWSARVIGTLAQGLGAEAFFPFGGPPWHAFQHWAQRGEGAVVSPVAMLASPSRGLWASYRGALGFAEHLALPDAESVSPCQPCPAPCLSACPVSAFEGGSYNVPRCTAHVRSPEGAACRDGCLVRQSCPAGANLDISLAQRQFHMGAFLAAQL